MTGARKQIHRQDRRRKPLGEGWIEMATGTHPPSITRPHPHLPDKILPTTKPAPARGYKTSPTLAPARVFIPVG
jgi:hypothetical protein